jgi:methanogenic corrinoid protein MtbC1
MLQQESRFVPHVHDFSETETESLSMIAYRSIAVSMPSDTALQQLLQSSQSRNKAAGLTGVLIHDHGAYFQWLEGPTDSLQRVWASILRDPRHRQITVLREEPLIERVFRGWDLRIALGAKVSIETAVAAMESSNATLRRVIGKPKSITDVSLEDAFTTIVIPRLLEVHGRDARGAVPFTSTASIWHADVDCGAQLAGVLMSRRAAESSYFVDSLLEQGANFNALYKEVFEPAQLQLGKLWEQDLCDDFHLTVGLARLQMEIRRVNAAMPAEHMHKPQHSVLLSVQLNEPHYAGLIMGCEVFERNGWDVSSNFPGNDQALNALLHTQWFDVLKLSQSGSLRRDSRLMSIRATIDAARAASLNPALIVMVDGRTFAERPQIYRAVHANAMSLSALDAAPIAERLLQGSRSVTATSLESVS